MPKHKSTQERKEGKKERKQANKQNKQNTGQRQTDRRYIQYRNNMNTKKERNKKELKFKAPV
jgi:hypothetical protein